MRPTVHHDYRQDLEHSRQPPEEVAKALLDAEKAVPRGIERGESLMRALELVVEFNIEPARTMLIHQTASKVCAQRDRRFSGYFSE